MRNALDSFEVEGIGHNLPFLSAVMDHPKFVSGDMTTAFIAEEYPEGFDGVTLPEEELRRIAAALRGTGYDLPKLGDGVVGFQLLDFALDPGLFGIFHEDVAAQKNGGGKFGLAGTVSADRVDMDTGADNTSRTDLTAPPDSHICTDGAVFTYPGGTVDAGRCIHAGR